MSRRALQHDLQDQLFLGYYRAIDLIVINLIWFVFSAPLVTAVPALGGLFYATNRAAHGPSATWRTFWEGFRACFWLSWRWAAYNAAVFAFLGVNLWFYGQQGAGAWNVLSLVVLLVTIFWAQVQLFTFPLLIEQTDRRFVVATRNSLVIFVRFPLLALITLIQLVLVAAPSTLIIPPAWIVISASLCAYIANRAVLQAISRLQGE